MTKQDCVFKGNKELTTLGEQSVNVDEAVDFHERCRDAVNNSKPKIRKSVDLLLKFKEIYQEKINGCEAQVNGTKTEQTKK